MKRSWAHQFRHARNSDRRWAEDLAGGLAEAVDLGDNKEMSMRLIKLPCPPVFLPRTVFFVWNDESWLVNERLRFSAMRERCPTNCPSCPINPGSCPTTKCRYPTILPNRKTPPKRFRFDGVTFKSFHIKVACIRMGENDG